MLPTFQPQNPAINHYYLGWSSCTAYSGAMAAAYHRQAKLIMTGEQLRRKTGDTVGGTNLAQINGALRSGWNIQLDVTYKLPWTTFAKKVAAGCGAVLQGWYAPIADSRFDAGRGFRGNHAIFVPPGWGVMDPLADGRASGVYKYHGEHYPPYLLRSFAGKLNVAASGYRALGDGYVYAAFTRDNVHTYHLRFDGGAFWTYSVSAGGIITGRHAKRFAGPTGAPCEGPIRHTWPGHPSKILVRVTAGSLKGLYVGVPQSTVTLETIP